jgi:glycosyltransferase involved in cell wall biosynthesis
MKIAVVSPVWVRVPPEQYGGIELVVHLLVEDMVRRGVDVTLFASGDSITEAPLRSLYPKATGFSKIDTSLYVANTAWAYTQAEEFDIIHNNTGASGISMAPLIKTPVVTTLHNNYFIKENKPFFDFNKDKGFYTPISNAQKREIPGLNFTRTVYNAIEPKEYPFKKEKGDFLLSLGNLWAVKGHDIAIEVAKRLGMPLHIAGKLDPAGADFFAQKVKPKIDDKTVIFEGQVSQERKLELFSNAKAMLFPIRWEEPFGLVMVEAMACGTPVIAFGRGSVPEVIKDGETGFIVDTMEEMIEAVGKLDQIDPERCREHVEQNFSPKQMADGYLEVFEEVLEKASIGR